MANYMSPCYLLSRINRYVGSVVLEITFGRRLSKFGRSLRAEMFARRMTDVYTTGIRKTKNREKIVANSAHSRMNRVGPCSFYFVLRDIS